MQARFQPICGERYGHWVAQQGKPRHIVSLLPRGIAPGHLARVTAGTAGHGLNIDQITRLSGRIPLDRTDSHSRSSAESSLGGPPAQHAEFRPALLEIAAEMRGGIASQEDSIFRRRRGVVGLDMDASRIEAEVIDELAQEAGVGDEVSRITEAAMRGEIDFKESFRRRAALLKGLDEAVLARVAARLRMTRSEERRVGRAGGAR